MPPFSAYAESYNARMPNNLTLRAQCQHYPTPSTLACTCSGSRRNTRHHIIIIIIIIIITGYMYLPTTLSLQWMRTYMFPQFDR